MRLRDKLTTTLGIQVIGLLATIVAPLIIARKFGPEAQGYLEFFRSSVNTAFTLALFGIPQALTYRINRRKLASQTAIRFAAMQFGMSWALLGVGIFIAFLWGFSGWLGYGRLAIICFILAVPFLMLHNLFRAILLSISTTRVFSLVTIITPVALCSVYGLWPTDDYRVLTVGMAVAGIISATFALFFIHNHVKFSTADSGNLRSHIIPTFSLGRWSYIQTIALFAVPTIMYAVLRDGGLSDGTAGNFSISVLAVGMIVTPLTMVVPVLFDDWSKLEGQSRMRSAYSRLANIGLGLGVLTVVVGYPLVEPVTLLLFGPAYLPSVTSTIIMLSSVYALFLARLLSAALFAVGKPNIIAIGAISRLLVIGALLLAFDHKSLAVAAISWVIGEYVGMVLMAAYLRVNFGWSLTEIFGFSLGAGKAT